MNHTEILTARLTSSELVDSTVYPFTVYLIEVEAHGYSPTVTRRRYSEWRNFYTKLQMKYSTVLTHVFPPKVYIGNLEPLVVQERKSQLSHILDNILHHPEMCHDQIVLSFLLPDIYSDSQDQWQLRLPTPSSAQLHIYEDDDD
eukprot:TRINITY_DN3232_c0_g1_i1.p1 TRINITY_DN3232_c0_g1~~TRINITY_DN3232_c0_g1_i1.p1  ORF type:complete len:144 (-),score=22.97 TRINITY_DN3232_c0_g1_i1:106-537(-)